MLTGGRKTLIVCIAYALSTIVLVVAIVKTGTLADNYKTYLDFLKWITGIGVFGVGIENVAKALTPNPPATAPDAPKPV